MHSSLFLRLGRINFLFSNNVNVQKGTCIVYLYDFFRKVGPTCITLGRSRIHFEDLRFNISLVTATSTRIQSEDVLHGAHVIDEM
jgi:hypothetical protein